MTKPDTQFKLRLPAELKMKLENAAEEEGRSLSAEIVQRLEDSFPAIEGALLEQRMSEMRQLKMTIQEGTKDILIFQKRLTDATSEQEKIRLQKTMDIKRQTLSRFSYLLARIQDDIGVIIAEHDIGLDRNIESSADKKTRK